MIFDFFADKKNRVFTVRELNLAAKQLLESGLPLLWVGGEISNFVSAASGHWYFSLKDESAQVRCVMFRHKSQFLDWQPKNGMQVEVLALPTLYEARGDFQLTLEQMRPAGLGALYEAFERLKRKLESEGVFDAARKRPLPFMPTQIGIITSPQAAALRDVLTTLSRRNSGIPIVLYPTPVQGTGSAEKIAQAIRLANERAECDVLLLCRGGGSIEDLWAFNEEVVARAIVASKIPVISGVGHETDFTIADFAADERAPTPTAAAQRVIPDRHALLKNLRDSAQHLHRALRHRLQNAMQAADYLQRRLVHPQQHLQGQLQRIEQLQQRLQRAFAYRNQHHHWQWQSLAQRLAGGSQDFARLHDKHAHLLHRFGNAMRTAQAHWTARLENAGQHLALLNPQHVLARGYSIVQDAGGNVVLNGHGLSAGMALHITFAQGWAQVEVTENSRLPDETGNGKL